MPDLKKIQKLAKIITHYSLELKKGDKVLLTSYGFDGHPLIKEIYRECVKGGALKVDVRYQHDENSRIFLQNATPQQLKYLDPLDKKVADNYDAMAQIVADANPYELAGIDPKKITISQKARKPLSDILHKKRWCLFYYPNLACAQMAKKSLEEWEDFVLDASIRDWPAEEKIQKKFVSIMSKVKKVRITGQETDLELSVAGQNWLTCSGKRNMPDGEIFTSPVRLSVNGTIRYNTPTCYRSYDFDWVKLTIKNGKVIQEESNNPGPLKNILNSDKGSRYFGEFAFGLNNSVKEPTRMILFDEKMGKSIHMALGKCYSDAPNGNDSSIHWDLIFNFKKAKAEIYFDGKKVFTDNRWIKPELKFLNE